MKICLISDTHMQHKHVCIPDCDILIHAGDYSSYGDLQELLAFNQWLGTLTQANHKIIISGNHDKFGSLSYNQTKMLFSNATYIEDELIEVEGLKIWGSPWSKTYGKWSFMTSEPELLKKYQRIPEKIDILVSHTPMYGVLDIVEGKGHTGSVSLKDEVLNRIKPRVLVAGHLHLNHGIEMVSGIQVITACICDEDYVPSREPLVIEL